MCSTASSHLPVSFFFFNDTATTEIYTLSLHDALPISVSAEEKESLLLAGLAEIPSLIVALSGGADSAYLDRKSTRLNSSHDQISYAVFCLKKKKILLLDEVFAGLSGDELPQSISLVSK